LAVIREMVSADTAPGSPLTLRALMKRADSRDLSTAKLGVGDEALDFELPPDRPFRVQLDALHDLHRQYGDRVAFFVVYIKEAHPEDGWVLKRNRQAAPSSVLRAAP
jgi:hypothetical protein